jgi:hypothetical protein
MSKLENRLKKLEAIGGGGNKNMAVLFINESETEETARTRYLAENLGVELDNSQVLIVRFVELFHSRHI